MRNHKGEARALRVALLSILQVIGPKPLRGCKENKCEGCLWEMEDARQTAYNTLKRFGLLPGSRRWRLWNRTDPVRRREIKRAKARAERARRMRVKEMVRR